jgi:hypothetical protein
LNSYFPSPAACYNFVKACTDSQQPSGPVTPPWV